MENFEKQLPAEKKEKPPFLYHASSNRNIEKFEPRAKNLRDSKEGPVVFATPDLALATTFLVSETNDSWTQIGKLNGVPYMVIGNKEDFIKYDKGGSVYKLPSKSFTFDPHKGMGENEWVSRDSVTPLEKEDFKSALEAMIEKGVQVFFVDKETFHKISHDKNFIKIIEGLESENKRRNKNVIEFKKEK
ncbi:MAG: hypothetical protein GF347_03715 [Candidatus Moranbacteria bacterium]|nr:hypothetical protein [Candidatus Moranbacteria bacterium]